MEKEKIYNTVSKRYLQINGQQYNKLISSGYQIYNNQLIPPTNVVNSPIVIYKNDNLPTTIADVPTDAMYIILNELTISDLLKLYNTNKYYHNILNNVTFLNYLGQPYDNIKAISFVDFINQYINYVIDILNKISHFYSLKHGFDVYKNRPMLIFNHEMNQFLNFIIDTNTYNNMTYVDINVDKAILLSKLIIPFDKIIIKHQGHKSKNKIKWYEQNKRGGLPKLSSKNYIKVIEPYKEIEIDASLKNDYLTIEDILFASRAFYVSSHFHSIGYKQFTIIDIKNDVLTLSYVDK